MDTSGERGRGNTGAGEWEVQTIGFKIASKRGFPGGAVAKNPPANTEDMGSIPGPGRSHMPQRSAAKPMCHNY